MSFQYPATRTVDVVEELAGVRFPDPYRWLEDDTEEVRLWQKEQAEFAASYVREWPHFDALRDVVAQFSVARLASVPRFAGGRWFRTHVPSGASQAQALVADEPFGAGRVLFDAAAENPDQPPFLSWISPSPDGSVLAIGVCTDGSEQNQIRLIDVATGAALPGAPKHTLMDNWTGGAQWLSDSSGFFFAAIEGKPVDAVQHVFLHQLGAEHSTTIVDVPWTVVGRDYRTVLVSRDGRYAVAYERLMTPQPVAVAELTGDLAALAWRPFLTDVQGTVAGHVLGDRLIAMTDIDAPRGRVVSIPLDSPTPNDHGTWTDIIPASDDVLRTITPVGDTLYVTGFVDTYARVRIVDQSGAELGEVPLPGKGAIAELPFPLMMLAPRGHADQFLFGFSPLTESWGVYRHQVGSAAVETLSEPDVRIDAVVEDRWATSADGTRVPYHVVRRPDVDLTSPVPALIYAYGGFNAPWVPQFPGPMAAFVSAGGLYVHGHLRGGGEYGQEWWHGGRLKNKQNCYSDLYAIAEDLIAEGLTASDRLCITGGSNGGLLSGVAVTQRPELWAAAVPRVPLMDILGACRDGYGRMAVSIEFGDPTDPDEVRRLAGFSPYQLVEDGRQYPAVFIDAGDTDPRCPPWHSRKFGARMQAAQTGAAPIFIRIWENVGHGWATDKEIAITENTEWLAFLMRTVGLVP